MCLRRILGSPDRPPARQIKVLDAIAYKRSGDVHKHMMRYWAPSILGSDMKAAWRHLVPLGGVAGFAALPESARVAAKVVTWAVVKKQKVGMPYVDFDVPGHLSWESCCPLGCA